MRKDMMIHSLLLPTVHTVVFNENDTNLISKNKKNIGISGVHVLVVSPLVDQLAALFLIFFLVNQKKIVQSQGIFVHSLEFFVQSFLKMWFWSVSWPTNCPVNFSFFEKDWTKNSREWTKKIWDWTNFFLVDQKKWEIDRTIGRPRDWPKPHGRD